MRAYDLKATALLASLLCGVAAMPDAALAQNVPREIANYVKTATDASNNNDCVRKSVYINRMWEIYQDNNHPFWSRSFVRPEQREFIRQHIYQRVAALNAIPCPRDWPAPLLTVGMSGGGVFADLPERGFLARETIGSGVQQLNQVKPTQNASGAFGELKIEVDNAPTPRSRMYLNFNYYDMDASSAGGSFDPGAGTLLNIPGPRGGASGFFLGFNPLNRVTDILFSNSIQSYGGSAGVRIPFIALEGGPGVDVLVGAGGNRLTMEESFGGRIPGFIRDFSYATDVDVNSAVLDLGLGVRHVVGAPGAVIITVNGEAKVSPGYYSGNGTDRLNFTGFDPSVVDLSKSKADVGFGVNGGLSFSTVPRPNSPVWTINVKGGYESRPGFPVIVRDGVNPSQLELKRADIFTVSGGLSVGFGR